MTTTLKSEHKLACCDLVRKQTPIVTNVFIIVQDSQSTCFQDRNTIRVVSCVFTACSAVGIPRVTAWRVCSTFEWFAFVLMVCYIYVYIWSSSDAWRWCSEVQITTALIMSNVKWVWRHMTQECCGIGTFSVFSINWPEWVFFLNWAICQLWWK